MPILLYLLMLLSSESCWGKHPVRLNHVRWLASRGASARRNRLFMVCTVVKRATYGGRLLDHDVVVHVATDTVRGLLLVSLQGMVPHERKLEEDYIPRLKRRF